MIKTRHRFLYATTAILWLAVPAQGQMDRHELRTDALRDLVRGVLADADTRASLLNDGLVAGWDGGFFIGDAAGDFSLKVSGQLQTRFLASIRDNSGADDFGSGFQLRRAKLSFGGHLVDPSLKFAVGLTLGAMTPTPALSDAYVSKSLENGWKVRAGQFKPPFLAEELGSSKRTLAVERSIMNDNGAWNQDRSQGVEAAWSDETLSIKLMLHDGFNQDNTPFASDATDYAVTGRVEWNTAGTRDRFSDYSSRPQESFAAQFGTAFSLEMDESGTAAGPEAERLSFTADVSLKFGGSSLFAAVVAQQSDTKGGQDFERYGAMVQYGAFVAEDIECFVRCEWGDLGVPGVKELSLITVGINRYFEGHSLKWQTDVGFGINEVDAAWVQANSGWQGDAPGEDGQIVLRTQLQLLF